MARTAAFITLVLLVFSTLTIRAMAMAPNPKKEPAPSPIPTQAPARAEDAAAGKYLFTPDETIAIRGYFRTSPRLLRRNLSREKDETASPGT